MKVRSCRVLFSSYIYNTGHYESTKGNKYTYRLQSSTYSNLKINKNATWLVLKDIF